MNDKKIIILSIILGVVVITGFVMGYLLFTAPTASVVPIKNSDLTIDVRSDGNIIQNNVYKYSLVVPQHWSLPNYLNVDSVDVFDPTAQTQKVDSELQLGMKVEVSARRMLTNQSLQSFVNEGGHESDIIQSSTLIISGMPAVQEERFDGISTNYVTYVKNGDIYIAIVGFVGPRSDPNPYKVTYQEIIKSFKLL